ncbi:hypothetical protein SAY87_006878 [Trapa incisa]|uniref:Uncharacterized protein n=1 Tax=Trapa incisa TaxID=236973 RepID=A0AAN7PZK5_9MYRT|nr:hypothetical protein SAY87_006878 [Trapa incisa]
MKCFYCIEESIQGFRALETTELSQKKYKGYWEETEKRTLEDFLLSFFLCKELDIVSLSSLQQEEPETLEGSAPAALELA